MKRGLGREKWWKKGGGGDRERWWKVALMAVDGRRGRWSKEERGDDHGGEVHKGEGGGMLKEKE